MIEENILVAMLQLEEEKTKWGKEKLVEERNAINFNQTNRVGNDISLSTQK